MKLKWGIVGVGSIAEAFAHEVSTCRTGELRSVGSRDIAKAQSFAAKFAIPASFGSYLKSLKFNNHAGSLRIDRKIWSRPYLET